MRDVTYSLLIEILARHDSRFVMSVVHEIVDKNEAEKKSCATGCYIIQTWVVEGATFRLDMMVTTNRFV